MFKNSKIIKKIFELNDDSLKKISKKSQIISYDWDSLTVINLITLMSNEYGIEIEAEKFAKVTSFEELDNLISNIIRDNLK